MNHDNKLKTFLPLLLIVSSILAATIIKQLLSSSWNISTAMTDFMGLFFVVFSCFKIINLRNFAAAYQQYDLIALRFPWYGYVYPFIELALGISYLFKFQLTIVNIVTIIFMVIGSMGIVLALRAGKEITCGCLGTLFNIPVTIISLLEDLVMVFMAIAMLLL